MPVFQDFSWELTLHSYGTLLVTGWQLDVRMADHPALNESKPSKSQMADTAQRAFVRVAASDPSQAESCIAGSSSAEPASLQYAPRKRQRTSGCPVVGVDTDSGSEDVPDGCPVISPDFNPQNLMHRGSNQPAPEQATPLKTERAASSIPIGAEQMPQHQEPASPVWMYPSQQMFYNAMKRKGWHPNEEDMEAVVTIHNGVNERAWSEVLRWERLHSRACSGPRLKRFEGRPTAFSPKARLLNFLGYKLPFDRHDWVVDRCGREVRYVVDFYNAAPLPHMPVAMHLDVRPALDSPGALWDRLRMQASWMRSGRWYQER